MAEAQKTIFRKIWDNELPSYPLYHNDDPNIGLMAILDIFPATRGQALVIPLEPVESWGELPAHRHFQAIALGRFLLPHLMRTLAPSPNRIVTVTSGEQVPHVHDIYIYRPTNGVTHSCYGNLGE